MDAHLIAGITGVISSVATIAAIKVDIGWIKLTIGQHNQRLASLEERINLIEKGA